MADELATITGTIYLNTADDPDRVPWPDGMVRAVPVLLDETAAIADSRTKREALTDSDGLVTLHLWPGAWRILLPDGEVIDGDGSGVVVEAGETYTLLGLRGYVAPPGTSVTTVELPALEAGVLVSDGSALSWGAAGGVVDADATTKGVLKLAGDLGGTADLPTVPGLADKANTADLGTAAAADTGDFVATADLTVTAGASISGANTGDQDLSGYALTADLGTAATLDVGTTAGTVAAGDDTRLTDARTPTAHASTHATGQSDALTPADIGAATAAQGGLADSAVQPGDLATVATTGAYDDLTAKPTLGDAAAKNVGTTAGTVAAGDHTHTGVYAPALGADDNYVTDAEKAALHSHANKTALDQVSGINTGDQVLPTWSTIDGKPAVVAAGATQADARAAIGAGTSSLVIGTTAGTAKSGDYAPDLSGLVPIAQPRNAQTGTAYTLVASDAGKIVTLDNAAAITVTVPASTIAVPTDTVVRVDFLVLGAGVPTFVGSGGMTINADPSLVADAQYAGLSLLLLSATSGVLVGRLATP